jgi:transposase
VGVKELGEPTIMQPTYEDLLKIIDGQNKRIKDLEDKVERLEKELHKYKNENTPSSANKHLKSDTQGLRAKGGKRGAPIGHEGITREQEPEEFNDIDANECPNCHGNNLRDVTVLKRITEEIPEPVQPKVVETTIHKKMCKDCGKVFIPPQNTIPLKGKFGINLMALTAQIKFVLRGVLRKTSTFLKSGFAFTLTPATLNSIIGRIADCATEEYEALKARIRNSTDVKVDETSFPVLGKNWWLWVFRNSRDILFVIRHSRGNDVPKEILGESYAGIVNCDCWRAYDCLSEARIQRCWAHLLRKSKELKGEYGIKLNEILQTIFKEIESFNKSNPTAIQRERKYQKMTRKLENTLKEYANRIETISVIHYIDRCIDQWFTCVRFPDVDPTNNSAEQAIREPVVVRKIIGAFRSIDGTKYYENIGSLIATWQLSGLDVQKELRRMLISKMCFC